MRYKYAERADNIVNETNQFLITKYLTVDRTNRFRYVFMIDNINDDDDDNNKMSA